MGNGAQSGDAIKNVADAFVGAFLIVGGVLGVLVLMLSGSAYPGANKWWLLNVVAPTWAIMTLFTGTYWSRDVLREVVADLMTER